MNLKLVLNIISRILIFFSVVLLVPLAWGLRDDPGSSEVCAFIYTILISLTLSLILRLVSRSSMEHIDTLQTKDGLSVVGLSWIILSLLGALPFYFSHAMPTFTDAYFETVSGFTTTGASILTDIERLSRGLLFWRSMTHWLGGMGLIVLYLAILPFLGSNAYQLYKAEAPGLTAEKIQPRMKETAKVLWGVYFIFTIAETVLLMVGGMTLFDALCHTFGTLATGGFSTRNASIGAFSPYIQWIVIVFMFLSGINFMLHYSALKGNIKAYFRNEEFRYFVGIIIVTSLLFTIILSRNSPLESPFRHAVFQVVSIMTTTGFVTTDFDLWPYALRYILILLMFIGASGGSTGGGMKVVRIVSSIKIVISYIHRAIYPNAVIPVRFNKKPLSSNLIAAIVVYFIIYILLFTFGTLLITFTERCDLVTAFSASIASLSNIGPGLGKVGATQNYQWMSISGKWILSFLMLAGRLELYSILILFIPATWKK
ncbi:TrkH family potassium uptake protein [Fidelibacter multiformis]|uniref:TrkH family potassium uptake protein n=1 Tax=Fidelibacter multiformis TaxID=3377529 RepID=UPI0037DC9D8A